MPTFAYIARDQQGNMQEGTAEADNAQALTVTSAKRGLWVQKVDATRSAHTEGAEGGGESGNSPRRPGRHDGKSATEKKASGRSKAKT